MSHHTSLMLRIVPGSQQRVHVVLELAPVGEQVRRPGRGELAEHDRPARGEAGVVAAPEGAGGGQREEVRQVGRQRVHHRHGLLRGADADVDVHAVGLDAPREPLHLLDELGVALDRCHDGVAPVADRVGAGAGERGAPRVGHGPQVGDCRGEVCAGLRDRVADAGDDLDGRLHELVPDFRVLPRIAGAGQRGQHLTRVLAQAHGLGVDELKLPLDAESRPS